MKRLLLSVLVIAPLITNAQFNKGDKFLGGTASFYSSQEPENANGGSTFNTKYFSFNPSMGFLLNENFAIGGQIGYDGVRQEYEYFPDYISGNETNSISAGIFAQRYFKISDKFLFTTIGLFNFSRGIQTRTQADPFTGELSEVDTHNYQLSATIRPSFIFFPSSHWGIEASLGSINYTFTRELSSTDDKQHVFDIKYGGVTLGFAYYFRLSVD